MKGCRSSVFSSTDNDQKQIIMSFIFIKTRIKVEKKFQLQQDFKNHLQSQDKATSDPVSKEKLF